MSADTLESLELFTLSPESVEPLISAFYRCKDQNIQAQIVRMLATIGDDRAVDLLVDMVGVEVANHCQGNVRRVAARGLGKMVTPNTPSQQIAKAVDKLIWALLNTEDWALRYAAALSLSEICDKNLFFSEIKASLDQALSQESDLVVKERIKLLVNDL